jgi:acetyl esterase
MFETVSVPQLAPRHSPVRRAAAKVARLLIDSAYSGVANGSRWLPIANPAVHGLTVERNVRYGEHHVDHALDVFRPKHAEAPLPVVMYVHGGGFRYLSKDTHWFMGLIFGRRGYLTYNVNYRLAPTHRFPAAIEDVCSAYRFVLEDAPRRGGDPRTIVIAGESAGANLVSSLALATCYERSEPWARAVFDTGIVPRAVVPACGILQVTEPERFERNRYIPSMLVDYISGFSTEYLGVEFARPSLEHDLADPLVVLERGESPARPLPPFFVPVGTFDPVLDDTRRLGAALTKLGVEHEVRYYERGVHAFHAIIVLPEARRCWRDTFAFLSKHVPTA